MQRELEKNCFIPPDVMKEEDYHADPCKHPSLSSTMANTLIEKTEIEAFNQSKRLNPEVKDKKSDPMDLGTMAHELILQKKQDTFVINEAFDAWRSDAAKSWKKTIEDQGKIALNANTKGKVVQVEAMRDALFEQLKDHKDYSGILQKGRGEVAGFAFDDGIWKRAKFDFIDDYKQPEHPEVDILVDYKTTGLTFDKWEKGELWGDGGKYIQNPHYRSVYEAITNRKCKFIWVVQRTVEPFLVRIYEIDDGYVEEVTLRYQQAVLKFKNCVANNIWRGEVPYTFHSYPPTWTLNKWDMDKLTAEAIEREEKKKQPPEEPLDLTAAG